jgi:hypothetical protein
MARTSTNQFVSQHTCIHSILTMSTSTSSSTGVKPTFAQHAIQHMIHNLLVGSGLSDQDALQLAELRIPPGFDQLIGNHKMLEEEKKMRSFSISNIVFTPDPNNLPPPTKFAPLNRGMIFCFFFLFYSCSSSLLQFSSFLTARLNDSNIQ